MQKLLKAGLVCLALVGTFMSHELLADRFAGDYLIGTVHDSKIIVCNDSEYQGFAKPTDFIQNVYAKNGPQAIDVLMGAELVPKGICKLMEGAWRVETVERDATLWENVLLTDFSVVFDTAQDEVWWGMVMFKL